MKRLFSLWVLLLFALSGCISRERLNTKCEWANDTSSPLDVTKASDERHLANDVTIAEELAIRYADVQRGKRSGHFAGDDEYSRTREQCMTKLFATIANSHRVDPPQVRNLLGQRPALWDLAILLSFATFYVLVSIGLSGWIFSHFAGDSPVPTLTATTIVSAMTSAGGVIMFELWVGISEAIRLRDGHMSYRALRLPWRQDRLELFVSGVLVFLIVAVVRRWKTARQAQVQSA